MNATELAFLLDKSREESYTSEHLVGKAATMLRQQQAEIEVLKKEAALQRLSDFTQEAECKHGVDDGACKECYQEATEPVAWINRKGKDGEHGYLEWDKDDLAEVNTPLYTHPVKEVICLTKAEIQSGLSRVQWAESLIKQLPEEHEGRNSWLLNYGEEK